MPRHTDAQEREQFLKQHMAEACCICGEISTTRRHALDHSHLKGHLRGILCVRCNLGLGNFRDSVANLERAIAYLKRADHYYDSGVATAGIPSRLAAALKA